MGIDQHAAGDSQAGNTDVAANRIDVCSYYLQGSHEEGSMLNMIYHSTLGQYSGVCTLLSLN